jgi:hypothetical protein
VERMAYSSDVASHMQMVDAVNACVDAQEALAEKQEQASEQARIAALREEPPPELPPERPKRKKALMYQVKF